MIAVQCPGLCVCIPGLPAWSEFWLGTSLPHMLSGVISVQRRAVGTSKLEVYRARISEGV